MREVTDKDGNTIEHVAIVRWVRRQNDPPRLFVLFANVDEHTSNYNLYACKVGCTLFSMAACSWSTFVWKALLPELRV